MHCGVKLGLLTWNEIREEKRSFSHLKVHETGLYHSAFLATKRVKYGSQWFKSEASLLVKAILFTYGTEKELIR